MSTLGARISAGLIGAELLACVCNAGPPNAENDLMRPLIAGNWKMHGLGSDLYNVELVAEWAQKARAAVDMLVCPPATLIRMAANTAAGRLEIGGQNCAPEICGAHTGDISAEMLKDAGASAVLVGHSERRQDHGETDALVANKAAAARRAGLLAIVCVGETEAARSGGKALSVVGEQIKASVPAGMKSGELAVGYEPLWAIGSGRMPTNAQIVEMHLHLRKVLVESLGQHGKDVRILYGGSVKPKNASEILALEGVNGALVGGASLDDLDFEAILASATAA
jgi:triosephosphate isomerase